MASANIERARAAHSALTEFFASHPKGRLDAEATRDVRALCRAAETAVSDDACRRAIRSIENYADLLASSEPASGTDFVRLRVVNALASFRSKLKVIDAA